MDASLLTVSETNGITILTLQVRDLVEHTVHPLRLEIQKLLPSGPARWVVDLPMTEFVASAGIGLVVQIAQRIGSLGGKLALCTSRKELRELFSAPYFVRTVSIFDSLPAAIRSISE